MNRYPLWKNALVIVLTIVGLLYALPNLYGEDPVIQIKANSSAVTVDNTVKDNVQSWLTAQKIQFKSAEKTPDSVIVRFDNTDEQLKAQDFVKKQIGSGYTVAINLMPATPHWLEMIGSTPMKYGLDLRGGVHFLLEVDVPGVIARREEGFIKSIGQDLRNAHLRYADLSRKKDGGVTILFRDRETRDTAFDLIRRNYPNLLTTQSSANNVFSVTTAMTPADISSVREYTIDQTMSILRNRVNELGVGEAVVQRQGENRIAVDLPGIQDAARAKQILGGTATLEFHMVDQDNDAQAARNSGIVPMGSKLYVWENRPYLLKSQVILSGNSITSAMATFDQQTGLPAVSIQLGGGGESLFSRTTRENIGKLMSIVYVETKGQTKLVDGKEVRTNVKEERVISVATIQSALGNNFQITGLSDPNEARNLALYLRAGALPAAIYPVEERTVGPTLGMENIQRGIVSLEVGMGLILVVMLLYYHVFGLIANIALMLNLVLLVAVLSLIGATLTLPGIAGIVLTVGTAVDANVLIYERIREELRLGVTTQAAIYAGYERAFATIVDANATMFIVVMVLFAIGSGPIRNFAVVTAFGVMTSMLTGVMFTRAIVNWFYGGRNNNKISIGM